MTAKIKQAFAPVLDMLGACLAFVSSPILYFLGRVDRRFPLSRKAMDVLNLSVIYHHYYSPMLMPTDIRMPLEAPRKLPGLDMNIDSQLSLIGQLNYQNELVKIPIEQTSKTEFAFHNGKFESGDAELLYDIIRYFKPRRFYEVGCGQSTLIARLAEARNNSEGAACEHICIEPYENDWLEQTGAKVIREKIETIDPKRIFGDLSENDILFIDSSHVIRPQGDVLHEYLELLPNLAPGVIVHVHDIFTPRDYPKDWVAKDRRLWNEQYLLEAFLSFNSQFEVLAALNFLFHEHRRALDRACPLLVTEPQREPGSFWFRRKNTSKTTP